MAKKPIYLFLTITFISSWLIWSLLWLTGWYQDRATYLVMTGIAMWSPAAGAIVTCRLCKIPWSYSFGLGLKDHWKSYLSMWFGLPFLIFIGIGLYFLVFSGDFDITLSSLRQLAGEGARIPLIEVLVAVTLFSILTFAPIINSPLALGEELGWRGFLYPLLKKEFGQRKADLLTGMIWTVWHLPILLMGHNYGLKTWGHPVTNVFAMFVACFVLHILFRYWLDKSRSIWIVALAHGSINAAATFGQIFLSAEANPAHLLFGPSPAGLLGVIPLVIAAIAILYKERRVQV